MKLDASQGLLLAAAFLAPLIGGQVSIDQISLEPGGAELMRSLAGGAATPLASHALVGVLTAGSLSAVLLRRQVLQVPSLKIGALMAGFFGILLASVIFSSYRTVSIAVIAQWSVYGLAFFATVASLGRSRGPALMVCTLFASCVVLAGVGLLEYQNFKAEDPNWRIFAAWNNPNALAGMLVIGLCLGAGLVSWLRDVWFLAAGAGTVSIGVALALTQSKGGIIAAGVGFAALLLLVLLWATPVKEKLVGVAKLAGCGVLILGMAWLLSRPPSARQAAATFAPNPVELNAHLPSGTGLTLIQGAAPEAPSAMGRVGRAGEFEQSAGFRRNLWKGALDLMGRNPAGYGIGTYRFESGRPGMTTQTHYAHNSFLQLGAEASIVAVGLLMAIGGVWVVRALRTKGLPTEQNLLRAGLIAAIVASGAHNMVDSDLYVFGIGWSFFALLGVGVLLSADAVTPEYTPRAARLAGIAAAIVTALTLCHAGTAELLRARARWELESRNFDAAQKLIRQAIAISPNDGEAHRLAAGMAANEFEREAALGRAAKLHPNVRNLRAYARHLALRGNHVQAMRIYTDALVKDPNNLQTLLQLMETQASYGDTAGALETAARLVAVEDKPYFQVRAIPEVVPVETAMASIFIARRTQDPAEQEQMLRKAVETYEKYLATTYPLLARMSLGDPHAPYGGDSLAGAWQKMAHAEEAAKALSELYRASGRTSDAASASVLAGRFGAAASPTAGLLK